MFGEAALVPVQSDVERIANLYGPVYEFTILRNEQPVGWHRLTFSAAGGMLNVMAESSIRIAFGPIPVYRFSYRAVETWSEGRLIALTASTDDNGDRFQMLGQLEDTRFRIESSKGLAEIKLGEFGAPVAARPGMGPVLMATNHWNPHVVQLNKVLNTLTGALSEVEIIAEGKDRLDLKTSVRDAWRWRYKGDFEATSWYDERGRWLALAFKGRDGSQIRYVCTSCQ